MINFDFNIAVPPWQFSKETSFLAELPQGNLVLQENVPGLSWMSCPLVIALQAFIICFSSCCCEVMSHVNAHRPRMAFPLLSQNNPKYSVQRPNFQSDHVHARLHVSLTKLFCSREPAECSELGFGGCIKARHIRRNVMRSRRATRPTTFPEPFTGSPASHHVPSHRWKLKRGPCKKFEC